jgi:hypothetical protein
MHGRAIPPNNGWRTKRFYPAGPQTRHPVPCRRRRASGGSRTRTRAKRGRLTRHQTSAEASGLGPSGNISR